MSKKASGQILRALQTTFTRAHVESRVPGIDYSKSLPIDPDYRLTRLQWASDQLGQLVSTFSQLSPWQAGYLLDLLNGKRPRIYEEIDALFHGLAIDRPDEWMQVTYPRWQSEKVYSSPRPITLATMNAREAIRIKTVLQARGKRVSYAH